MVLSAPDMQWDYARKLIDSFETIVSGDQIKNCDMRLAKHEIHVQLTSTEAAKKLIEHLNNREFMEKTVSATFEEKPSSVMVSPMTGPLQSSSSPPQLNGHSM